MEKQPSVERIAKALTRRFEESPVPNTCQIHMKLDGAVLVLTLCSAHGLVLAKGSGLSVLNFDRILVSGPGPARFMGGRPREVCQQIRHYRQHRDKYLVDLRKLAKYRDACGRGPTEFQTYSAWYEDLMGAKPDGWNPDPELQAAMDGKS